MLDQRLRGIEVGDSIGSTSIHLSLQRLIMVAAANRDFALSHSVPEAAQKGGAPTAYADVMFVFTMFERLLMEWAGPLGRIKKLGPLRIADFVVCGQDVVLTGVVTDVRRSADSRGEWLDVTCRIEISQNDGRTPVSGLGTVVIPAGGDSPDV
jgi:hypothetical protein